MSASAVPVIDQKGRVLRLVNIVDLLVVLLGVAVFAAGSALALPRAVAGPLTAVVAVVSVVGLVLLSRWRFDVSWDEVVVALREAWPSLPSRPYLRKLWRWFTAEPEPEVVLIDLRETVTMGPVIIVLDWGVTKLEAVYRGSVLERALGSIVGTMALIGERTGLSRVAGRIARLLAPPESPDGD